MMNVKTLALALMGVSMVACQSSHEKAVDATPYMLTFEGTLPAADCPGIETTVKLSADSTAAVTRAYLADEGTSETELGHWTLRDSTFVVALSSNDSVPVVDTVFFKMLPSGDIVQTGETGEVNPLYQLKPAKVLTAKDFEGSYSDGDGSDGSYVQTLTLTPTSDDEVKVDIVQTGGKGKGCDFHGVGKVVNNQIEVNLATVSPEVKGTMVIRRKGGEAQLNVFTSRFDDRYSLMYFCGGGGSLAGDYTKN